MSREPISDDLRRQVFERDDYKCRYCGTDNPPFHLDHVYPVSKGGETSLENLVTSCATCNMKKHTSIMWPNPIRHFEVKKEQQIIKTHKSFKSYLDNFILIVFGIASLIFGVSKLNGTDADWIWILFILLGTSCASSGVIMYFFEIGYHGE